MKLPLQQRPKTLTGRLQAGFDEASRRAEVVRDDAVELVRGVPGWLDISRKRALAIAGGAASAAAGFAFWRSRRDDRPSAHQDPARPSTPWKMSPPPPANGAPAAEPSPKRSGKRPVTDTKAAAADAAGTRSK